MKELAVILSLYKNDKLDIVKQSIESLLSQTYHEFDLYIKYDGYVDSSIDNYLCNRGDNRIIISKRNENLGLAYSLNELLQQVLPVGYTFIARMDSDDISMSKRFECQMAYFKENPSCDCLGTWAIEIDNKGQEFFKKRMPLTHTECLKLFRKRDCMIHPSVMYRRTFFKKAGFYADDTYFGEDTMMWAKGFASGCHFANLPQYLLKFRLDENFFQRRRGWKHAKSIFKLRVKVNRMLGFGIKEDFWAILYAAVKIMPTPVLNVLYKTLR